MNRLIEQLRQLVGAHQVLAEGDLTAWEQDWRKRSRGKALAVVRPGGSWLVVKVLPLCVPVAGLLRNRLYTYRWVSLLVWIYFTEGVVRATSDRGLSARLALAEVVLCMVLFAACVLHVRIRLAKARK